MADFIGSEIYVRCIKPEVNTPINLIKPMSFIFGKYYLGMAKDWLPVVSIMRVLVTLDGRDELAVL